MAGPQPAKDEPVSRREGKRYIFEVGLVCNIIAALFIFISFATSNWITSWPRVHSGFKRIGLWEACFAGLVLETDPTQKAYHGCWWILAPEYWNIRTWIMPWWFIMCQIFVTICWVAEIIGTCLMFIIWLSTGGTQRKMKKSQKKREGICMLQTGTAITVATACLMTVTILLFGIGFKVDYMWLPNPWFNYLSWSFGLAVVSTFLQGFATIAQVTYTMIIRQEMREAPLSVNTSGYLPSGSMQKI